MADNAELLRLFYEHLLKNDPQIKANLEPLKRRTAHAETRESLESLSDLGVERPGDLAVETIVSRTGRPVLEVVGNDYELTGPESDIWQQRLGNSAARATIGKVIPAVGRIEVEHHRLDWLGTGWLVTEDVVVTNRHVAEEFVVKRGSKFVFRSGSDGKTMTARIDFHEEFRSTSPAEFSVLDILHIEDDDGPDMAFLKVARRGGRSKAAPLTLARSAPSNRDYVATVGYPAEDSRIPDQALVLRIFGNVYNVKRLAPGQVMYSRSDLLTHDCSTLGGNSGSPVFRLDNGEVVALHFAGLYLRENRSVPAAVIADRLEKLKISSRSASVRSNPVESPGRELGRTTPPPLPPKSITLSEEGGEASWTIPLHVSVKFGKPTLSIGSQSPTHNSGPAPRNLTEAVEYLRRDFENTPDVLAVREGYRFRNGWITDEKAVVVLVKGSKAKESRTYPTQLGGLPVEVRVAGPWDYVEAQQELEALEGVPTTAYKKPGDFKLERVHEDMSVTCHVSPDAGWATLEDFLGRTKRTLTIGMYDFTAPHIVQAVKDAVDGDASKLTLVLQAKESLSKTGVKAKDIPEAETVANYEEELGARFKFAWASVGKGRQFASSYHIKVAVQDGKAFWLSSGNWQSSNQPAKVDKSKWTALMTCNREWNLVVRSERLAEQFEKYIKYDYTNARREADDESLLPELAFLVEDESALEARQPSGRPRYFPAKTFEKKISVMPLLTPDNYQEEILKLIESAKEQVLFQNQSLSLLADDKNDKRFTALAEALRKKQARGLDVRIIMRGEFDVSRPLEQLQDRGFDMDHVRLQDRCHTKGIIVDGKRICVGSHNWTNQGTLVNRDASVIFDDAEIADYFRDVFEFDWKNLTRQSVDESRQVLPMEMAREAPSDMIRLTLEEILLD